jgi:hypothetical protein
MTNPEQHESGGKQNYLFGEFSRRLAAERARILAATAALGEGEPSSKEMSFLLAPLIKQLTGNMDGGTDHIVKSQDEGLSYDFSVPDMDGKVKKEDFDEDEMPEALTELLGKHQDNQEREEK